MAEIVLRGDVNVAQGEQGMKQMLVLDPTGDVYRIPLPPDCAHQLAAALQMDEAELRDQAAKAAAAQKLVIPVPGFNGDPSSLN